MSGLVTKETNKSVSAFIDSIENDSKRKDSKLLIDMMSELTGHEPKIWGDNFIIGFGKYKYRRKTGKEEFEWFNVGFAPRKSKITLYLTSDIEKEKELISQLGKCKHGRGCLYINKLADIDLKILRQLIAKSKDTQWN
ncbi:DUF1801 domain-containing protein [Winogradskyella haliclonae]|uniref:YdhG-like domain-containing protein n=1 Tax=Winogradskyella haliclonae TaxID=2048558 RepID=A0ABQ2BZR0_9FLAO|nr:DUF1801 domain-containing protein [Winogradskyella haliclonae]GGI57421.1 hypothetical protein GCM10011444_17300 [Winogradskyella haliclonae]